VISQTEIYSNIANSHMVKFYGEGGGLYATQSTLRLYHNQVHDNTASIYQPVNSSCCSSYSGGGSAVINSYVDLKNNDIMSNTTMFKNKVGDYNESTLGGGGLSVVNSSGTIADNRIQNNWVINNQFQPLSANSYQAVFGGGVYLSHNNNLKFQHNTIQGNVGTWYGEGDGGGMWIQDEIGLLLEHNLIQENIGGVMRGGLGGGVFIAGGQVTLTSNLILSNTATLTTGTNNLIVAGGGIVVAGGGYPNYNPSIVTMNGDVIQGNVSSYLSGGIYFYGAKARLVNVVVANNKMLPGIKLPYLPGWRPNIQMVVEDNSSVEVVHSIITNPKIDGFSVGLELPESSSYFIAPSVVTLTNSIIASQTVGIEVSTGSTMRADGLLWYNVTEKVRTHDNITALACHVYEGNPAFAADGYHLTLASAARNRGVSISGLGAERDIDGDLRLGRPDLGVDELLMGNELWSHYLPIIVK